MTLEVFCATATSSEPTPGGRGASALTGTLAATLTEMVAQLTIGKKDYEEAADEMRTIIPEAAALHAELLDEITRDSTSFNAYIEAVTLSKDTDERKEVHRNAMQEVLKKTAEVPLYVTVVAIKITPMADTMVKRGNANAVINGMVAAIATRTTVLGTLLSVKINLDLIKDEAYVADVKAKIHEIKTAIVHDEAAVLAASPLK